MPGTRLCTGSSPSLLFIEGSQQPGKERIVISFYQGGKKGPAGRRHGPKVTYLCVEAPGLDTESENRSQPSNHSSLPSATQLPALDTERPETALVPGRGVFRSTLIPMIS